MTRNILGNSTAVGPVVQFALLLSPWVMSCFYLVYALAGWVIDGRDRMNWSIEAPTVAVWVLLGMGSFCGLVIAYTRWKGGSWWHPLVISSVGHLGVTVLLTISILIRTGLS